MRKAAELQQKNFVDKHRQLKRPKMAKKKEEKLVKLEEELEALAVRISLTDPELKRIDGIIEEVKSALTEGK